MNDFTKEELQKLLALAKSIPIDDRILILNLESAIEHYCDHKSEVYECTTCHTHECSECGGYWR